MKKVKLIALLAAAAASLGAALTVHAGARPNAASCGGNLWRLKTLSDPNRRVVRLKPRTTTIGAIGGRHAPKPVPTRRTTPFQKQSWEVVAEIVEYRLDGGQLRLILFDNGAYVNGVIPSPSCLSGGARNRPAIAATWKQFTDTCGHPTNEWQPLGAVAYVRGVGFWSQRRTTKGAAPNGAELHPVTGFRPVAGCGS